MTRPDLAALERFARVEQALPAPAMSVAPSEILHLLAYVGELERTKNDAYAERNRLVAALSTVFPASLERHPEADTSWEDDWRWIVFIDLPTGQASWHLHNSHLPLFDHVPRLQGRTWDGHTTEEKYARLARLAPDASARGVEGESNAV